MAITHTFVSGKSDGADTSLVRPSNWNADHTIGDLGAATASTSITTPIVQSGTTLTLKTNGTTQAVIFGTDQSATFAGVITATSPVFTTPAIGVATGTSLALTVGANATASTISGYSVTGSGTTPLALWSGALNNGSTVLDVFKIAITNTATGAGSKLLNLYAGASGTTSIFAVGVTGKVYVSNISGTNVFIGDGNTGGTGTGVDNVAIGSQAFKGFAGTGSGNTIIGISAAANGTLNSSGSSNNTAIGYFAGQGLDGAAADNTVIGQSAGYRLGAATKNTYVGSDVGVGIGAGSTQTGNVFLGYRAGYYETGSSKFFIDNQTRTDEATSRTSSMIYGVFNATVASQTLAINAATTVNSLTVKAGGSVDISAIAAGSPNFVVTATSDTPGTTWNVVGTNNASAAPSGYIEISVGGNARYIPFFA